MPALEADATRRDGAWLVELSDLIDQQWGDEVRVTVAASIPNPGAELALVDIAEGFRHQVFITDEPDVDIAGLELQHRHGSHVPHPRRPRTPGCATCRARTSSAPSLAAAGADRPGPYAWAQWLCFEGDSAVAEPNE